MQRDLELGHLRRQLLEVVTLGPDRDRDQACRSGLRRWLNLCEVEWAEVVEDEVADGVVTLTHR